MDIFQLSKTIQMKIFNNVKHCQIIFLELGEIFFASLTMLECETKACMCCAINENLILYCRKFLGFVVAVIN